MMRVLIADDEPLARRGMEQLLERHADCSIVASCRNGDEAVRALRSALPEVAFLDIRMPGLGGFEVLDAMGADVPVVVFVTAYDEFAVRAFEARALDYLLKPVSQDRFDRALERVRERLRAIQALASIDARLEADPRVTAPRPRVTIVVPTNAGEIILDAAEVDWIEAQDYCAAIHASGRRHLIRESLSSLEGRLDPAQFIRVHRSAIVRIDNVRELRTDAPGGGAVILRDGTRVPLSRRRRECVKNLLL